MNLKLRAVLLGGLWLLGLPAACSRQSSRDLELKRYPLDDLGGVIQASGVEIDLRIKAQGRGALRIAIGEPSVIRLFETGDIDVEDGALIYRAKIRTEKAEGNVYLEMWCVFEGQGEFFSRGLQSPLKGTNDWTSQEIPFFLKTGENPSNVKLNLVSEGGGTVWVDDIRLVKRRP